MKISHFFTKKSLGFYFLWIIMWGCAIPIPVAEQNFNQNLVGLEYATFDLAAESIFIYQKEKKQKNEAFLLSIKKDAAEKPENKTWSESAQAANEIGLELTSKIEDVWDQIVTQSGGRDAKGHPLGADQKIVADKILFKNDKAIELSIEIYDIKKRWLELIPSQDKSRIESNLPDFFKNKNWLVDKTKDLKIGVLQLSFAHLTFGIEKVKEDLLIYFWEKINSPPIVFDRLQVMANPQKSFVKKGEKYEADIFLSPILNPFGDENMTAVVNGKTFPFRGGVAKYRVTTGSIGEKKYDVQIKVKDPITGEVRSYEKPFEYKVGMDATFISATKMNVLYIGVDNPIKISAAGVPSSQLKVSITGGGATIKRAGKGYYRIRVTRPTTLGTEVKVKVEVNGKSTFELFRVKRIPNPVAKIGKSQGGSIGTGEFKAQNGVLAVLDNFDFEARCKIQGFVMTRIPKQMDGIRVVNRGARYTAEAKKLINEALPGDIYTFDTVKVRCPGDPAGRKINSMVFKIK